MADYQAAYFFGDMLWMAAWAVFFYLRPDIRKEMLIMSFGLSWLGITQLIYAGSYWTPQYLFPIGDLPLGLEDFILCFAYGGLATALYKIILKERAVCPTGETFLHSCKIFVLALAPGSLLFLFLNFVTDLNVIYTTTISMFVIGLTHIYLRPQLSRFALLNGLFIGTFAFLTLLVTNSVFPGVIDVFWRHEVLSGYALVGVPIEEIINHFCLGFAFGLLYEVSWHCRLAPFKMRS